MNADSAPAFVNVRGGGQATAIAMRAGLGCTYVDVDDATAPAAYEVPPLDPRMRAPREALEATGLTIALGRCWALGAGPFEVDRGWERGNDSVVP